MILRELENIHKYVIKSSSPILSPADEEINFSQMARISMTSTCSSSNNVRLSGNTNNIIMTPNANSSKTDVENDNLKKENEKLKNKIDTIDKKFDKICEENTELREYVKEKTDNLDGMRTVLDKINEELKIVKRNQNVDVSPTSLLKNSVKQRDIITKLKRISNTDNSFTHTNLDLSKINNNINSLKGLDTLSLKSEFSLEDQKNIFYGNNSQSQSGNSEKDKSCPFNAKQQAKIAIPKLNIFNNKEPINNFPKEDVMLINFITPYIDLEAETFEDYNISIEREKTGCFLEVDNSASKKSKKLLQ